MVLIDSIGFDDMVCRWMKIVDQVIEYMDLIIGICT